MSQDVQKEGSRLKEDDQHSSNDDTFREKMKTMLTRTNTTLDPKQRDQLMAILIKHKGLRENWVFNSLMARRPKA